VIRFLHNVGPLLAYFSQRRVTLRGPEIGLTDVELPNPCKYLYVFSRDPLSFGLPVLYLRDTRVT
jgi:hypothetical protein